MSRRTSHRLLALSLLVLSTAACVSTAAPIQTEAVAQDPRAEAFRQSYGTFVDAMRATPYAPPGFVVVISDGEKVVFEAAYGVRDATTGAPMTLDTPIYTASTTKSYVGLLAAQMDANGALPLDTSLHDIWPDLTLPDPLNAEAITITGLLSHSSGMVNNGANFRTNISGDLTTADMPAHLARYASARPGYAYSNLGPVLYTMMLETRTGEDWRDALAREVFQPLGLTRTSIRPETLPGAEIAHCNARLSGGWRSVPLKADVLLNAGGGVFTSGRDAGRWVRAFATGGASAGGRVPAEILARTWAPATTQTNQFIGLRRDGYGLGWDLGEYEGHRLVTRSGGITGCMSIVGFVPATGFSVAILSVGEGATFPVTLLKQAIDSWSGNPEAAARAAARPGEFTTGVAAAYAELDAVVVPDLTARALPESVLQAYAGAYDDGDRLGRFQVGLREGRLVAVMGAAQIDFVPTGEPDGFTGYAAFESSAYSAFEYAPLPFRFVRNAQGAITAMHWDDRVFTRLD